MILALLLGVTATGPLALPADPYEAAMVCRSVFAERAAKAAPSTENFAQAMYFGFAATRAKPKAEQTGDFVKNLTNMSNRDPDVAARASEWTPICDATYPLARARTVKLPVDAFRHDVTCLTSAAFIGGFTAAAEAKGFSDPEVKAAAKKVLDYMLPRMNKLYPKRVPQTPDAQDALMLDMQLSSTDIGNFVAITRTCAAEIG